MKVCCVNVVEKSPVPKSQTKPFYIGTKEAPVKMFDLDLLKPFKGLSYM